MIRDDFKDVKKVSAKEERKKASMGERSFYAKKLPRLKDLNKAVSFSTVLTLIMLTLAYAIVLTSFILAQFNTEVKYSLTRFIIWSCVYGAVLLFALAWFIIIRPRNEKKIERYKLELERLSAQSLGKISAASTVYGEDYVKKLAQKRAEERENAKRAAERKVADEAAAKAENTPDKQSDGENTPSAQENSQNTTPEE